LSKGSGAFSDPSGDCAVTAPAVLWLFPGVAHSYRSTGTGWTEHWILFEGVTTRAYESLAAWDRSAPVAQLAQPVDPRVLDCFTELRELTSSPSTDSQLLAATVVHRLIGLARTQARSAIGDRTVVDQVSTGFANNLSVAERAARVSLSPAALREQVRVATGLTVHELILRTRLARAQQLLTQSALSIGEIARLVGYEDPAYFSRLFQRRTGLSPLRFRRLP